jgi:hypothetical protein
MVNPTLASTRQTELEDESRGKVGLLDGDGWSDRR